MPMSLQEIEDAIDALAPEEVEQLYLWLDAHHPQPIDHQLQADLDAGFLDDRIARALADHESGRTKAL